MEIGLDWREWNKRTQVEGACNDPGQKSERKMGLPVLVKALALAR